MIKAFNIFAVCLFVSCAWAQQPEIDIQYLGLWKIEQFSMDNGRSYLDPPDIAYFYFNKHYVEFADGKKLFIEKIITEKIYVEKFGRYIEFVRVWFEHNNEYFMFYIIDDELFLFIIDIENNNELIRVLFKRNKMFYTVRENEKITQTKTLNDHRRRSRL